MALIQISVYSFFEAFQLLVNGASLLLILLSPPITLSEAGKRKLSYYPKSSARSAPVPLPLKRYRKVANAVLTQVVMALG